MAQEKIKCPKCGAQFELTEVISKEIEASISQKYAVREKELKEQLKTEQQKLAAKARIDAEEAMKIEFAAIKTQLAEKTRRLDALDKKELELIKREQSMQEKEKIMSFDFERKFAAKEKELDDKLKAEKRRLEEGAKKKAQEAVGVELGELKEQLDEKTKLLSEARSIESDLRKKKRELEDREAAFEIEMGRKLDEERNQIVEKAKRDTEDAHRLKDAEKDKQFADMKKQIEDLKRKAEQGSQQMQGEVLELELEQALKTECTFDDVDPVPKGIKGGDVIQTVKTQAGRICGKILWETKRTKIWNENWIQKIKDNQREAKADIAVLVSEVLPKGFHHFREVGGVWITDMPSSMSLAVALRSVLIQTMRAKDVQSGKEEKKEIIYSYFTGTEFKNRVQAIMEAFVGIKNDLDSEKRLMERMWAKREKQIEKVVLNIAGMRGDLEGIAGVALPAIKLLELPSSEQPEETPF